MAITYAHHDWHFDAEAFGEALQKLTDDDIIACAELMDVSRQSVERWKSGKYKTDFNFPRMSNFIHLCNLLDLDPRDYFTL